MNMVFSTKRSNRIVPVTPPKNYMTNVPSTALPFPENTSTLRSKGILGSQGTSVSTNIPLDRSVGPHASREGSLVAVTTPRFSMFNLYPSSACSSCGGKK
jgi:hypothetical protein